MQLLASNTLELCPNMPKNASLLKYDSGVFLHKNVILKMPYCIHQHNQGCVVLMICWYCKMSTMTMIIVISLYAELTEMESIKINGL